MKDEIKKKLAWKQYIEIRSEVDETENINKINRAKQKGKKLKLGTV